MKIKKEQYELKTTKRGVTCYFCGRTVPKDEKYYKNTRFLGNLSSPANVCLNCWSIPQMDETTPKTDPKQSKLDL